LLAKKGGKSPSLNQVGMIKLYSLPLKIAIRKSFFLRKRMNIINFRAKLINANRGSYFLTEIEETKRL
jgi:hypothetical protein